MTFETYGYGSDCGLEEEEEEFENVADDMYLESASAAGRIDAEWNACDVANGTQLIRSLGKK